MEEKIYIITEDGFPHVANELNPYSPNRLAAASATWNHCKAFDGEKKYEAVPEKQIKLTLFQKFLAHTIYNPSANISVGWKESGTCELKEIRDEIKKGLEADDDIIQQWFDAGDVIKLIESTDSFDGLVDRIRCVCGEFEVDERLRKIVDSVLGTPNHNQSLLDNA